MAIGHAVYGRPMCPHRQGQSREPGPCPDSGFAADRRNDNAGCDSLRYAVRINQNGLSMDSAGNSPAMKPKFIRSRVGGGGDGLFHIGLPHLCGKAPWRYAGFFTNLPLSFGWPAGRRVYYLLGRVYLPRQLRRFSLPVAVLSCALLAHCRGLVTGEAGYGGDISGRPKDNAALTPPCRRAVRRFSFGSYRLEGCARPGAVHGLWPPTRRHFKQRSAYRRRIKPANPARGRKPLFRRPSG